MSGIIYGHIYGKDLTEIQFVFDSLQKDQSPTPIELGQILIIEDKPSKARFLVRVTNILYGQSMNWSKDVARQFNQYSVSDDEHTDPLNAYGADLSSQQFNTAICETLGYIDEKKGFMTPKRLPSHFSQVRTLDPNDFNLATTKEKNLADQLGDIPFGVVRSGSDTIDVKAGLFKELVAKHVGIFAQTGGGKSNTMKRLLVALMETEGEVGSLVFEPHGEYISDENLVNHPLANERMLIFSADGSKGRKLFISHNDLTVDALMNIRRQMNWSEPQERFMREAEYILGNDDWFRTIVETPYDAEDAMAQNLNVPQTLKDIFPNTNPDTIKACKSKLFSVSRAKYLDANPHTSNISEILKGLDDGKIVLIDMASLGGLHEILLSTILSSETIKRRKRHYQRDKDDFEKNIPPVAIVMEEAQRVLGKDGDRDSNVFAQICNEGRKFRTGLFAITQQPKLMNEVLISQFNTLIILSISDQRDFDILSSIAKKPIDKLRVEIRSLMPGQAIVTNPNSPFAVPMQVDFLPDYMKKAKEKYKKKKKKATIDIL